jgi:hypothetical protein
MENTLLRVDQKQTFAETKPVSLKSEPFSSSRWRAHTEIGKTRPQTTARNTTAKARKCH